MEEYVTDAFVLRKDPRGDLDGRYTLFTRRFGKIAGRATSSRKITSKLAQHLEPGMLTKIRFVEARGTQLVDALKSARVALGVAELAALADLVPEGVPEPALWEMLAANSESGGAFSWREALATLGWDPAHASCIICGSAPSEYFYVPRQEFYCRAHAAAAAAAAMRHASKAMRNAVSFIHAV
jgi:recombinational DNA repair protein (RecF pathway)